MKKLLTIAAMTAMMTTAANADIMRIEGAVGAWQTSPTGTIEYDNVPSFNIADTAGFDTSTNMYAWVYLKHPIPIVPNVRLEYVDPNFDASTNATLSYGGYEFGAGASNALSLKQYDAVLYYNILDNTLWSTIDLGLDVKYIDGNYNISGSATASGSTEHKSFSQDFSLVMPLAYARARVQIPVTNIGIETVVRGITYSDNTVIDAEIKIDYTMDFIPVVQPGLELGYRYQQVKLDASSINVPVSFDTTFSGVYAGIMVRF